jgi:tetratricopeptide (TPR) repeat protein
LCQNHAKMIDDDEERYTIELLLGWKEESEQIALINLAKSIPEEIDVSKEIRIPLDLPQRTPYFTDRENELAELIEALQPGKVVTLFGPGGMGKTALAVEALWIMTEGGAKHPEIFPDGVMFYSFYGKPDTDLVFEQIIRHYGEEPKPTPEDAARRALAGKEALLILDGTEAADNINAVLDVRGNCGVLVTSRSRGDAPEVRHDIPPLERDDAADLLKAWAGDRAKNEQAIEDICDLVGGLPLAVKLAGHYMQANDIDDVDYLKWLEITPLQALDHGERRLDSVPVLMEKGMEQVSDTAASVLSVVGLLGFDLFEREWISASIEIDEHEIVRSLGELTKYGLIIRDNERYKVSHSLVLTFAHERMPTGQKVLGNLCEYFTRIIKEESKKGLEGYKNLHAVRPHVRTMLQELLNKEQWVGLNKLAREIKDYLNVQGFWIELLYTCQIALTAANIQNEKPIICYWNGLLGNALFNLGNVEKAIEHYEIALVLSEELKSKQFVSENLGNLASSYAVLGKFDKAIEYHDRALVIAKEVGDRNGECTELLNLGIAYNYLEHKKIAIKYHEQALIIAQDINDRQTEGNIIGSLGNIYRESENYDRAREYFETGLEISRQIGHRRNECYNLGNLGSVHYNLENFEEAITNYKQAIEIASEIGDQRGVGIFKGNLSNAYLELGNLQKAIELTEEALDISIQIGFRQVEVDQLRNIAKIYLIMGELDLSREKYIHALEISKEIFPEDHPTTQKILEGIEKLNNI